MDGEYYYDDWTGYDPSYYEDTAVQDQSTANDDVNWYDLGDGTWFNGETGEYQDDFGNSLGFQESGAGDANADENWVDLGDGSYVNQVTGEMQDYDGNTLGYLQPGDGGVPLFGDADSGLQERDGTDYTGEIIRPVDVDTAGGGFLSSIGNFFSNLFGSSPESGKNPSGGGSGGGASSGGGGSGQGSQQQNQQTQQYQQAIQQLQQQLAAAQRANANANVTDAIRQQISQLQGGGSSSMTQTFLIAGGVGLAVYFATRNRRAA